MANTATHTTVLNGTRWQRTRAAIRQRDGNRCQACGDNKRLAVHHIIPRRHAPDLTYEPSNLITLCVACHNAIEPRTGRKAGRKRSGSAGNRASSPHQPTSGPVFEQATAHTRPTVFSLPAAQNPGIQGVLPHRRQSRHW